MCRYFIIAYVSVLTLFSINLTSNIFFLKTQSANVETFAISKISADIESISLDKEYLLTACLQAFEGSICSENNQSIKVSTKITANDENDLTFYYTVSAGKIIGNGSDVIWDLSRTSPGRYSITVGAGKDNVISGKTLTKYITVKECICHPPCLCPFNTKITGPTSIVKEGDSVIFSARVDFDSKKENLLIYDWKVINGEIIEGQGTNQILVKTNQGTANKTVTATLEVTNSECDCPREEAKTTVNISKKD